MGADQDVARVEAGAVAELAKVGRGDGSWELVAAVQAGDREAYGRFYERYLPQVQHFLRVRVRDAGLVEDLTSETFLRALRRIDTVSEQRPDPGAWLVRIARNLVFDHTKSARHRREWVTDEVPEPRTGAGVELGVEERAQARADRTAAAVTVARCLDGLTPPQRCAVQRYEMPVAETAAALGITAGSAKNLRQRAARAMREHLADEGLTSSQDCRDAAQTRPHRTDRAAGENTSADRDAERGTGQGRTSAEPAEAQRADEVVRESEPAAVDQTAVAVARAGEAVARLRAHRPAAAAAGGEQVRAEELTRWHADDQATQDETDDQVAQDEVAGRGWVADRCAELEGSVR